MRPICLLFCLAVLLFACEKPTPPVQDLPAIQQLRQQRVQLPNGWALTPAGTSVALEDLPLNLVVSPDAQYAVATHNGASAPTLALIELATHQVVDTLSVPNAWLGLAFAPAGDQLFVSGGNANRIWRYGIAEGQLVLEDSLVLGAPWPEEKISVCGISVTDSLLFTVTKEDSALYVYNWQTGQQRQRHALGHEAYTCLVDPQRATLYISLWGGRRIARYHWPTNEFQTPWQVGSHPNDLAMSADAARLFVANANDNTVSVIDLHTEQVQEQLNTALYPDALAGSTPNSLCLSGDGKRLFVANADNNCLAVFDVEEAGETKGLGFIPTGWYPTAVRMYGDTLLVANGKGAQSLANPKGPQPGTPYTPETQYIGRLLKGTLSFIPLPDEALQAGYSKLVYENTPYDKDAPEVESPVFATKDRTSPIEHVFYVIKENRTYDQVFGDMPQGNGEPSLCLFPDSVTPNQHALAREFVLLDNFYVNAEVSADGHNWSMAAYANDYVEKTWPTSYGRRGGTYDYEGSREIAYPDAGFLWDACVRAGVSYRSYGEFVWDGVPRHKLIEENYDEDFPAYDLSIMDTTRYARWEHDFDSLLAADAVPGLNVVRFGNDHTAGAREGYPTPAAMVADNDLAVGKLIEHISHSAIWEKSAIFILEDDAQNGPDHVDAHRSIALVVSPYTKRHAVDNHLYTTCSMLRTMERILGMEPMSQYDAAALPMASCFTDAPNVAPFEALPANINLRKLNPGQTALARESATFDFSKEDAAPDIPLNRVVWKAVRGMDSEMPAPRRSAFVWTVEEEEAED